MFKEFKEFAMKGSLLDMATGIIIGAAFGTVISSLVGDILMPVIGQLMGGVDFSNIMTVLGDGKFETLKAAEDAGAAVIKWGVFINHMISFLIVAFVIFLLIKGVNKARKAEEEAPAEPPRNEVLLEEIRDALKTR